MKAFTLFRRLFLGSFFLFWGLTGLYAQDTIQLTWQGGTNKLILVDYPLMAPYFPIRINWGDGFMTDTVAEYNVFSGKLTHFYADTTRNYAVTITSYRDSVLTGLFCESQQVSHLDISRCAEITIVNCIGNQLPLSELYKILENMEYIIGLGISPQHLLPQQILVGSSVDFSDQAEFGDTATVFKVEKNGIPAALNKIIPL